MITRVKDLCYHSVHQPYSLKPVRTHGSLLFEFSPALQISPCSSNFPCSSKISNLCSSSKCWPDSFESVSAYLVQSRVPCMYPVLILRTTTMPCLCLCNLFTLFHVHRKAAHSNGCAAVTHTHTHTHTQTHTHTVTHLLALCGYSCHVHPSAVAHLCSWTCVCGCCCYPHVLLFA